MPLQSLPSGATPALRLLGGLCLSRHAADGEARAPASETRHHVQAVLALAGASRQGLPRDEVVDMLWPKSTLAAGRNRLYHTVHLARQALSAVSCDDDWVMVRQSRLLLSDRVWCDVHEIERASLGTLSALPDGTLHTALSLCRGDWMPQLDLGVPGHAIRLRLRRTQSALLREAVARLRLQGDTPTLRAHLEDLLQLEPTDEPAHRELMLLDLAAGRRHAVLRTFDKVSRALTLQLGLKPTAQTRGLAEQAAALLAQAPPALSNVMATHTLVGREPLSQALVQQMSERGGIWNLTGMSGVGKSALARHVAQRLQGVLPDGVVWVRLGDLSPHDTAAAACVRALGLNAFDARSDLQLLAHAVQTRSLLLVLDDLDSAADATALLAALPQSMQSRLIVTSRAALVAAGASDVPVPALATPGVDDSLEQARQSAGFVLFLMRCSVPGAEIHAAAWQRGVVRLLQRLDGLPLAIELAAARSSSMTPGEILHQVERGLHPLADGPLDLESRHRSMQSALDWSARLLSEPARRAYAAAAIFPGAFERGDVSGLSMAAGLTPDAMQCGIDELLAAGLLSSTADPGRLRMLHLPRAHARALGAAQGLADALRTARLHAICSVLAAHCLDHESPACAAGLHQVMALEEDAMALLEHARAEHPPSFVQLCAALCESWTQRNLAGSVQRLAPLAIACAQALGDKRQELLLQLHLTLAWRRAGLPIEAEQHSRVLPPLANQISDKPLAARAVLVRSQVLRAVGEEGATKALLESTLATLQLQPADEGYWTLARLLPSVLSDDAILLQLPALRVRLAGSPLWPRILSAVGSYRAGIDDWSSLLLLADEVVQISRDTGWLGCRLDGLWHRAACLLGQDRQDAALENYQEYRSWAQRTGWDNGASLALHMMASLHMRQGRLDAARALVGTGEGWSLPDRLHAWALRDPLMHATILVLDGRVADAVAHMHKLPLAWLQQVDDNDLTAWSELAALLAAELGWSAQSRQLALDMRRFDGADDHLPHVRRFRDQRFGPGLALQRPDSDALQTVRKRLRTAVAAVHARLSQEIPVTVTG